MGAALVWGIGISLTVLAIMVAAYLGLVPSIRHAKVQAAEPRALETGDKDCIVYASAMNVKPPRAWWWAGRTDAEGMRCHITAEGKYEDSKLLNWPGYWMEFAVAHGEEFNHALKQSSVNFALGERWYIPLAVRRVGLPDELFTGTLPIPLGGTDALIIRVDVRPEARGGTWFYILHARDTQSAHFKLTGPFATVDIARNQIDRIPW